MWGAFKKPTDPFKARERELEAELARLREEVERLSREEPTPISAVREPSEIHPRESPPRSTPPPPVPTPALRPPDPAPTPINHLAAQKFDPVAAWRRALSHLRGPTANNPRMARMLAAGSIHGLRPLRYERRVARNRFIALFVILVLILWGLGYTYLRNR
ncbi:MAG: hypothetical protein KF791_02395 [Verrucomicrobiae bacterium]|nr:hypothetical protein [Verrucomicrobiae bacterium]